MTYHDNLHAACNALVQRTLDGEDFHLCAKLVAKAHEVNLNDLLDKHEDYLVRASKR